MGKPKIERVSLSMGAQISGIDLREPLSNSETSTIRQALLDHQVLFFRDQHLDGYQFKALGSIFGTAYPHFVLKNLGGELKEITEIKGDGSRRMQPALNNQTFWHADGGYFERPTEASLLMANDVPPLGGDTSFINMYDAYEMLHPALREAVEKLEARHAFPDVQSSTKKEFNANLSDDPTMRVDAGSVAGRVQPLVIVHPETGRKALNINRQFTREIVGMPECQARHLFDLLVEHSTGNPEFQVRFKWELGSIAIWDNRCTLHRATADFAGSRTMWRITIAGTSPAISPLDQDDARKWTVNQ